MKKRPLHIGFVSTRIAGTDGVSLEIAKWAQVLEGMGHQCFYFAGQCDRPEERSYVVPEAFFQHPEVLALTRDLFDDYRRSSETSGRVQALRYLLKCHLYRFRERFDLNLLIAENALSLPVHIPLGLALTEFVAETEIPTVAHHHDFAWERVRFARSAAEDYLRAAFPPTLPSIVHVTISSFAARQLALRTGVSSLVIPNVMDFDHPPPLPDEVTAQVRQALGIPDGVYFILQPTRVVPRKRIEQAIELVRRLDLPAVLVVSHRAGDEGLAYQTYLAEVASLLGVQVLFAGEFFAYHRHTRPDGQPVFSLADAYANADLVTYPSAVEGFGNAFLEAIYYRRPLVMSAYEIFRTDIQPKGFKVVAFEGFVDDATVAAARRLLTDPEWAASQAEHNYRVAQRHFSYRTLEVALAHLLQRC
ncbi:MAG TPA: glycosyltransferase family 4 protein [Anaerolineae bacterium]|nr:glycosyltransferase family 4 protein [Anaerolineae bacterium]HID84240.1 glycosyltransferase [Anaerolineales bacterium]